MQQYFNLEIHPSNLGWHCSLLLTTYRTSNDPIIMFGRPLMNLITLHAFILKHLWVD